MTPETLTLRLGPQTFAELQHKHSIAVEESHNLDGHDPEDLQDWKDCAAAFERALVVSGRLVVATAKDAAQIATETRNAADICEAGAEHGERSSQSLAVYLRRVEHVLRDHFALTLDPVLNYYKAPEAT